MGQADIAEWAQKVKQRDLLKDRGDGDRDWMEVSAPDGSILQLRLGRTYTRVVWSERNPPEKPFSFCRFVALEEEDWDFPKNLFIRSVRDEVDEFECLTAAEVYDRLFNPTLKDALDIIGPAPGSLPLQGHPPSHLDFSDPKG